MAETLLSPSGILLYGRVLQDITFTFVEPDTQDPNASVPPPPRRGDHRFLRNQLAAGRDASTGDPIPEERPYLARIYGFSYEGRYYDLPKPAIFLVHGLGVDPEQPPSTSSADMVGVARRYDTFAENIRVWSYDRADFSVRLDVETGPFEKILIEALLGLGGAKPSMGGAVYGKMGGAVYSSVGGAKAGLKSGRGYGDE